jgi:hypothetical protein
MSLRADDVDERMGFRVEPVAGNAALYRERSLAFPEIKDFQEEVPCGLQIAGANGDVVEVHVKAPFCGRKLEHSHRPYNRLGCEYTFRTFRMMISRERFLIPQSHLQGRSRQVDRHILFGYCKREAP